MKKEVPPEDLFWVRMCDVQKKLSIVNMSDAVIKLIRGTYGTKELADEQYKKY